MNHPELFANRLTSSVRDRQVRAPEYKVAAVRVERATVVDDYGAVAEH